MSAVLASVRRLIRFISMEADAKLDPDEVLEWKIDDQQFETARRTVA